MNKILVTGCAGFIGYHLCKSLLIDNYEVLGIDNLNDYYDPRLKRVRLDQLKKYSNFSFSKIDIANKKQKMMAQEKCKKTILECQFLFLRS